MTYNNNNDQYIDYDDNLSNNTKSNRQSQQYSLRRQQYSINNENNNKPRITIKQKLFHKNKSQYTQPIQQQYHQYKKRQPQYKHILSNPQTIKLLDKYFNQFIYQQEQFNITLEQFIKILLIQTNQLNQLSSHHYHSLLQTTSKDLTTTNPSLLSFNALQILNKKHPDIKHYFISKIAQTYYNQKKKQLQVTYKQLLNDYSNKDNQLENRKRKIQKIQYQLKQRENQIIIEQKNIKEKQTKLNKKQKQLIQRDKNIKIILKEKADKIIQQHSKELQKITSAIASKSVAFEKNARMKLQTIQRKVDDLKQLKILEASIMKQKEKSFQGKNQNPHQQYINKIKKLQRDIQKNNQYYCQSLKKLQDQNTQFLKASSILQSKVQKLKQKLKRQKDENDSKGDLIKSLQLQLRQKHQMIQELIISMRENNYDLQSSRKKSLQNSNMNINRKISNNKIVYNREQTQIQKSKQKQKTINKNKYKMKQNALINNNTNNIKNLIEYYEMIIQMIIQNLDSSSKQRLQSMMIKQVDKITINSIPVILMIINMQRQKQGLNIYSKFIWQFVMKSIAMTCSVYKYQQNNSLKEMLHQSDYQVQLIIQKQSQEQQNQQKILMKKIIYNNNNKNNKQNQEKHIHINKQTNKFIQRIQSKAYQKIKQFFQNNNNRITFQTIKQYILNVHNYYKNNQTIHQSEQTSIQNISPQMKDLYLILYFSLLFTPLLSNNTNVQAISFANLIRLLNNFQLSNVLKLESNNTQQLVTYLFHIYIHPINQLIIKNKNSYNKANYNNTIEQYNQIQDALYIIDTLLQYNNSNQKLLNKLYTLENYRILLRIIVSSINTQKEHIKNRHTNTNKNNGNNYPYYQNKNQINIYINQIVQKCTIIIQRLVYIFNKRIMIKEKQIKSIKNIIQIKEKQNNQQNILLVANLKSILSGIQK